MKAENRFGLACGIGTGVGLTGVVAGTSALLGHTPAGTYSYRQELYATRDRLDQIMVDGTTIKDVPAVLELASESALVRSSFDRSLYTGSISATELRTGVQDSYSMVQRELLHANLNQFAIPGAVLAGSLLVGLMMRTMYKRLSEAPKLLNTSP